MAPTGTNWKKALAVTLLAAAGALLIFEAVVLLVVSSMPPPSGSPLFDVLLARLRRIGRCIRRAGFPPRNPSTTHRHTGSPPPPPRLRGPAPLDSASTPRFPLPGTHPAQDGSESAPLRAG